MSAYLPMLIVAGLALFVLRTQLLRIAMMQASGDASKVHASAGLGAASGWASLFGFFALIMLAILTQGWLWGLGLVVVGLAAGVLGSALFLPMLGSTQAMGHLGGEGNRSIAEFNKLYGHNVAFAVAGCALLSFLLIYAH
jgi:hypothetical protein